ncbi:mannonate dehydratase [Mucilaginibacter rubeus]|uniref:Mannonate dehydratase n=1 Tax=Mucilaginibacter rubeus TaxID=2027860 RepID=A0AAE6JIE1_9SPHI|nr:MULTISPECIES: mannonate dehydratase [Mucilaginibacter]QEM06016.1 mannonate dehydratase [Mucilaginibacter rubeus]QEM18597.1 mannonate dehydratase [Mucilaginibacter gossypii]QTE44861.1 mannonate dehydratase [Mucilaginibacter rubeus]QTE51459.1 mannonate dehydratase [Mucilaginibacter rubeus]QTE56545.1 mannonate dehydratase [Mucilaginibacter rubeus]
MVPDLKQTFRWFGPGDPVTLSAIKQTGASGIVTALHHIPCGDVWDREEIRQRKAVIESAGFNWVVVESVNIHESIKIGSAERDQYIDNYIQTLQNLASEGVFTVCYNFMPVLDWTRTHLDYQLANGASALLYNAPALAAFDLYILKREDAFNEFTTEQQATAKHYFDGLSDEDRTLLTNTILAGLPGTDEVFTIAEFKEHLNKYSEVDAQALKENLFYFLRAIIPYAEKLGIKMCIHPDDPPFPILGLPRVASSLDDLIDIVNSYPSVANGITLCTGSLGASGKNDLPEIISRLGNKIHFLHLRNVARQPDGSFYEADHLTGSVDMYAVMKAIINEQMARKNAGRSDMAIPMRPDHGHKLLDDFNYDTYPGYSVTGRLKGLAELRGLEMGIKRILYDEQ